MLKIETSGAGWSSCPDRFVTEGYRKGFTAEQSLEELFKIKGLNGFPLWWGSISEKFPEMVDGAHINGGYIDQSKWTFDFPSVDYLKEKLAAHGVTIGTVAPDTYMSPIWKNGSFTNRDPAIRRLMIEHMKMGIDEAAKIPGSDVLLWMGHDGYDYPFEDDYRTRWNWLLEGIAECCDHNKNVKLTIEYKTKEPRTRQYISDYGKALFICKEIGAENLGVVVDIGHSLFAGENPAEAVDIVSSYGKLHHIHMNDNYRSWDDDLYPGAIHFWENLEMFYVLNQIGYDGWYTIDVWPTRVDGHKVIQEAVDRIHMFDRLAKMLPLKEIKRMQAENDTIGIQTLIRETVIK